MDFNNCPCSGKKLAKLLRPAILTLLAREPLHGYELLKRLAPMALFSGQAPDAAGMYRVLHDMEEEGLLSSNWAMAKRGPAKRRYAITETGTACLDRWITALSEYQNAIAELLGLARNALQESPERIGL